MVLLADRRDLRGLSAPHTIDSGLGADGRPVKGKLRQIPFPVLLETEFQEDAHFVCYELWQDGQPLPTAPRLRKEALGRIRELGAEVSMVSAALDVDLKHQPDIKVSKWDEMTPEEVSRTRERFLSAVKASRTPPTHLYATRGGLRIVYELALPVPAGPGFEAMLGNLVALWRALGVVADPACTDWTRLYRAPAVVRDGVALWKEPWFWVHSTGEFLVPEEKFLTPWSHLDGAGRTPDIPEVRGPYPEDEAADLLIWEWAGQERQLTPDARRAEIQLRSTPIHSYVFGHTPFARSGYRHQKLAQLSGLLVSVFRSWATPEFVYALALQAIRLIEQDEDWRAKAWEMCHSFWARTPPDSPPPPADSPPPPADSPPPPADPPDDPGELSLDKDGKPYPIPHNVRVAIGMLGVRLTYDEFGDRFLIEGLPEFGPVLEDAALTRLWLAVEEQVGVRMAREKFALIVLDLAMARKFHPVRDYFRSIKWDGVDRIGDDKNLSWLTTYLGVPDSPYVRSVGRCFMIGAVRRIVKPGSKFDEMLLLEGPQGSLKSTAIQTLAVREDWFTDSMPIGIGPREVLEQTGGKWIVEASDLQGLRRQVIEELKAFLARRSDKARMVYDRLPRERPRQFVIVGSTNSDRYLLDDTGNRRFWPVCVGKVDLQRLQRDRDLLWAEAVFLEGRGESSRLPQEKWEAAAEEQAERQVIDPIWETLSDMLPIQGALKASDAWELVGINRDRRTQAECMRLGQAMKNLGWKRKKLRWGQKMLWTYEKDGGPKYSVLRVSDQVVKLVESKE